MKFAIHAIGLGAAFASLMLATPAFAQNMLQAGTTYTDSRAGGAGTTLGRNEVRRTDNFSAPQNTAPIDTAFVPGNFSVPKMELPPAPPAFSLAAQSDGAANFQGQQGVPGFDNQQQLQQSMPHQLVAQQMQQPPAAPADPDSTPEMKLLWDAWHRRVAEAVFIRYSSLANAAFANSPPIGAIAAYTVTRDGHISNVRLNQKSANPAYNAIVLMAIQSLNGNMAILQFPDNSRRMSMEKVGQFTQNYGQNIGFKTIVGDQETIPGRR